MDYVFYIIRTRRNSNVYAGLPRLKQEEPVNRVHFFVARDMDGRLFLYIGKPIRVDNRFSPNPIEGIIALGCGCNLQWYGLNENNYKDLKWEDESLEVFVNMED